MFNFLSSKKKVDKLRREVQDSFENVKDDIHKVGDWIKHIDVESKKNTTNIDSISIDLNEVKASLNELKNQISFLNPAINQQTSTGVQTINSVQTNTIPVQAPVQTGVQTGILEHLTMMERAIVFILLNNNEKLSYEDISVILGKQKSTVRGQINSIKQKNPGLICEFRELNGKKRLYIDDKSKDIILKNVKVRVNGDKNSIKN